MTEKEFANLKVGDKVRIVAKDPTNTAWNGCMRKWLGKVMTIRQRENVYGNVVALRMQEDKKEHVGDGWYWYCGAIACKVADEQPIVVEHLIRDNKTIVKLSNGKVGVAKCAPEDKFDICEGLRLATERAYGKREPAKKAKIKEVKRPAKVGEWIKIVNPELTGGRYKAGDIMQVTDFRPELYKQDLNNGTVFFECEDSWYGWFKIWDSEYVVLEGYEPSKK